MPADVLADPQWEDPRVTRLLERERGIEGLLEWSESFLGMSKAA